jgi:hypothetical protein
VLLSTKQRIFSYTTGAEFLEEVPHGGFGFSIRAYTGMGIPRKMCVLEKVKK